MPLITLTTDFGANSTYVAEMKAAALNINPHVNLVDVTHDIPPQDVQAGALVVADVLRQFPAGAIHAIVVDPGVGTSRQIVLCEINDQFFICPNNGLLWPLATQSPPQQVLLVDNSRFWRTKVSQTFHGRDIMVPVAAHLSVGEQPTKIASQPTELVELPLPPLQIKEAEVTGCVIHVDSFGNLITNIPLSAIYHWPTVKVAVGSCLINELSPTYGVHPPGTLIALGDSHGRLEIASVNGNAAHRIGATVRSPVKVTQQGPLKSVDA